MEQVVVKTEMQSNGEILLYYVDENGENQEGVLTTIENIENSSMQIQNTSYILSDLDVEALVDDPLIMGEVEEEIQENPWSEEDIKRLLIFYTDNKISFTSGATQKRHLWAVACKTMLVGKNQQSCQEKLDEIKSKYCEVYGYVKKGLHVKWPFLDLCHQAFHDDPSIEDNIEEIVSPKPKIACLKQEIVKEEKTDNVVVKYVNTNPRMADDKVELMLNIYLKYKDSFQREIWRRDLWDKIAAEMGEEDSLYLQKRFQNHKQTYINMLLKKKQLGSASINWPYMEIFDKIFGDDIAFHKKYFNTKLEDVPVEYKVPVEHNVPIEHTVPVEHIVPVNEWNETQKTVLVKYYFDCFDEFEDPTIPNNFLWTEVGRLIDKPPENCKIKYETLRKDHLEKYKSGNYNLSRRPAIAIILDSIISKDVKIMLSKSESTDGTNNIWKTEEVDALVQFFLDNIEVFKDPVCHFVCWSAISNQLKRGIDVCKKQWDELVIIYNSILEDKKENPDMQIDWRYIELFDRIFDFGMDSNLINGYNVSKQESDGKVGVKKVTIQAENNFTENGTTNDDKNDPDYTQQTMTDPRSTKILDHYLKNKDKFTNMKNKLSIWDSLAKQIGMNSSQCAHRFRTLKQTYIEHIQKEIDRPRVAITWPYYLLCKKVFGYRTIKNKLKLGKFETDPDDWLAREIKSLISYFSKNFYEISNNSEDVSKWGPLAMELGKSENDCREKFVELRKCYRKLKTMRSRNPEVKISWSYFNMFDRIYSLREEEAMEVETLEEEHLEMEPGEVGEEDYQCIIVLQEGQEIPANIGNAQIIIQKNNLQTDHTQQTEDATQVTENLTQQKPANKWTKRAKKRLLIFYINYIRSHRGKEINAKHMWADIASKLPNKTAANCRKLLVKMKNSFRQADDITKAKSPYTYLLEKVLKLKPKFVNKEQNKHVEKTYKDVQMTYDKVEMGLNYYLEHIEEFVNPKFERKFLWTQLANYISEPVTKVYNKINYLKQAYNIETEEIAGQTTEFSHLLKEIIAKEVAVKIALEFFPNPEFSDQDDSWTDDEIEQLLLWYLSNLDKFKNPKFNKEYLWRAASTILSKSPLVCSKKMTEIRTMYRNMVKQHLEELKNWRFFELCQKIYGTGKRTNSDN